MTEKEPTLRDVIRAFGAGLYRLRGTRCVAKGRYDRALADFDRAIELYVRAVAYFDRKPERDVVYGTAFGWRGGIYLKLERYDDAVADGWGPCARSGRPAWSRRPCSHLAGLLARTSRAHGGRRGHLRPSRKKP